MVDGGGVSGAVLVIPVTQASVEDTSFSVSWDMPVLEKNANASYQIHLVAVSSVDGGAPGANTSSSGGETTSVRNRLSNHA